jgi:hypothetical protein
LNYPSINYHVPRIAIQVKRKQLSKTNFPIAICAEYQKRSAEKYHQGFAQYPPDGTPTLAKNQINQVSIAG